MTSINVDLALLKRIKLTPDEYCILWCLFNSCSPDWIDLGTKEDYQYYVNNLKSLEQKLWIKKLSGEIEFRKKSEDLFKDEDDVDFEDFWDKYHDVVKERKKTDKVPAEKYWIKMSRAEKRKAYSSIQSYYDSVDNKTYCKKARTYLSDKNYNDEFIIKNKQSTNSIGIFKVRRS